ncbi:MAG: hypothetical protein ACLR1T_14325 [Evtepia gabavorous]
MEDLDPDRCRPEYLSQLADDLIWLGLDWDLGWRPGRRPIVRAAGPRSTRRRLKRWPAGGWSIPAIAAGRSVWPPRPPTPPTAPESIPAGAVIFLSKKKPLSKRAAVLPPGAFRCRERSFLCG